MKNRKRIQNSDNVYLYRYTDYNDEITLNEYILIKKTNKGVWINQSNWFDDPKWVKLDGKKPFCHYSKEDAWNAFMYRKNFQIKMMESKLRALKSFTYLDFADIKDYKVYCTYVISDVISNLRY